MKSKLISIASGLFLPILLVLVWDWCVKTGRWPPSLIAGPGKVYHKWFQLLREGVLWENMQASLFRLFAGFLLGSFLGILLGICVGLSRPLARLLEPLLLILIPVPPLAWIPLLIIAFGIDQGVKIALLSIGSFCTLFLAASFSARSTDKNLLELSALYGKSGWLTIRKIILPSSAPAIVGSLRVAMALSWTLLMASEMIAASSGLGWFIWDSRNFSRPDDMISGMITVGLLGWLTDYLLLRMGRYFNRWKVPVRQTALSNLFRSLQQTSAPQDPSVLAAPAQPSASSRVTTQAFLRLDVRIAEKEYELDGKTNPILSDIGFAVKPGDFISIIGPSGTGKTTLLKILAGLDLRYKGQVLHDGLPVTGTSLTRGIVFQEQRLLPWMRVEANIAFGMPESFKAEHKKRAVRDILQLVGLEPYARAYPGELSGGMLQRVALARSLVNLPDLLLLDEPFGALDSITRDIMQKELLKILQHRKTTVVMVTHDIDEAIIMSDRIIILGGAPATIKKNIPLDKTTIQQKTSPSFIAIRNNLIAQLYEKQDQ